MTIDSRHQQLEENFSECAARVQQFFRSRGFSPEDSEDLSQETLLRALRGKEFRGQAHFSTWIFSIASNVWKNHLRSQHTAKRHREEVSLDAEISPTEIPASKNTDALLKVLSKEQKGQIATAIQDLPSSMRTALTLRFEHELNYREIAQILQVSINTVKSQLHQGRLRLQRNLGENFDDATEGSDNFSNISSVIAASKRPSIEHYMEAHKGILRPATLKIYARHLRAFFKYSNRTKPTQLFASAHAYYRHLVNQGKHDALVAQAVAAMRSFLRWYSPEQELTLKLERQPERKGATPLTKNELGSLFKVAADDPRDIAGLTLMVYGGLRPNEIVTLSPCHFKPARKDAKLLHLQGERERRILLSDSTMAKLRPLLDSRDSETPLFQPEDRGAASRKSRHMTGRALRKRLRALMQKAGICKERATTQVLRDTFAYRYLQRGESVEDLQKTLGHLVPAAARRYAALGGKT